MLTACWMSAKGDSKAVQSGARKKLLEDHRERARLGDERGGERKGARGAERQMVLLLLLLSSCCSCICLLLLLRLLLQECLDVALGEGSEVTARSGTRRTAAAAAEKQAVRRVSCELKALLMLLHARHPCSTHPHFSLLVVACLLSVLTLWRTPECLADCIG